MLIGVSSEIWVDGEKYERQILTLAEMDFVGRGESVIFGGHSGTGKSHLAQALLLEGCRRGRMDFLIAGDLNRAGYSSDEILSILEAGSPELEKRKAGHVDDYLQRTLAKVKEPGKAVIGMDRPQASSSSWENPRGFHVDAQETGGKHED